MPTFKRMYLAVDPGPTTGISLIYESDLTNPRFEFFTMNYVLSPDLPHLGLFETLTSYNPDLVICERFQFRPDQKGADIRAAAYQGVVELWCQMHEKQIVLQNSSLVGRTAFWNDTNDRVKTLGLYNHKAAPHGMDALRHFLYYYTFTLKGRYFLEKLPRDTD